MANACRHDQHVPALRTMNAAVEIVGRFFARRAADDTSAFNTRANGSSSLSTSTTGPGPAAPLQSASFRSFLANLDGQTSPALSHRSMSLSAAPGSQNFIDFAQLASASASASMSLNPSAARATQDFQGVSQISAAFGSTSMSSFAASATDNHFAGVTAAPSLRMPATRPSAARDRSRSQRRIDTRASGRYQGFRADPGLQSVALIPRVRASARNPARNVAPNSALNLVPNTVLNTIPNSSPTPVPNPVPNDEPVRPAVADQGHHSMGAEPERRTLRRAIRWQQGDPLVEADAQANEANAGGNEAGRQMAEDHSLALRLQHAERRAAVQALLQTAREQQSAVQDLLASAVARRGAFLQAARERERVMLEHRRAATQVALGMNTAELVHKSTPRQSEGDSQQDQCSVCLEKFQDGDQLRLLPCMHKYHRCCIDEWFQNSPECPVCKHSIIPSTSTASASQELVVID